MANQDAAFGLQPVSTIIGVGLENLETALYLPASYATAVGVGTPVKLSGTSNTADVKGFGNGKYVAGQLPEVTLSAADENIDYIITGFAQDLGNEDFSENQGLASTERVVLGVPAPYVVCQIQASGSIAATDIGSVANITAESVASTGRSSVELDVGTIATGSSAQLTILGVAPDLANQDISSDNVNLMVRINESNLAIGSNGV